MIVEEIETDGMVLSEAMILSSYLFLDASTPILIIKITTPHYSDLIAYRKGNIPDDMAAY